MRADANHALRDEVEEVMDKFSALWMVVKHLDLLFRTSALIYLSKFISGFSPYLDNRGFPVCPKFGSLIEKEIFVFWDIGLQVMLLTLL